MNPSVAAVGVDSLVADAVFCGCLGAGLIITSPRSREFLGIPPVAARALGIATVAWSRTLVHLRGGAERSWRFRVGLVGVANTVGSAGLVLMASHQRRHLGNWLALAGSVAAFAFVQTCCVLAASPDSADQHRAQ